MTGSGAICGSLGIRPGTGGITPDGGTLTVVGHMTGTGIAAMLTIIIIATVPSVPDVQHGTAIVSYTAV